MENSLNQSNLPTLIAGFLFLCLQILFAIRPEILLFLKSFLVKEANVNKGLTTSDSEGVHKVEKQLIVHAFAERNSRGKFGSLDITKELFYFDTNSLIKYRVVLFKLKHMSLISDISTICYDSHCAVLSASPVEELSDSSKIIYLLAYEGFDVLSINPDLIILKA